MDHFDGNQSHTQNFDVNAWAREYFLEANSHLVPFNGNSSDIFAGLTLNITEMNLSGTISLDKMNSSNITRQTQWKTPTDQNPVNAPKKPQDMLVQVELPGGA
mmetsp:Transcript_21879/g.33933  ORF Transcript_21879/g.33933 Transcript_21879/m.33933 type:complete len:103 (+) Transcript_21879:4069-4377(+)